MASENDKLIENDAVTTDAYMGPPIAEAEAIEPASEIAQAEALSALLFQMRRRLELRRRYLGWAAAFVATLLLIVFAWVPAYSAASTGEKYVVAYLVPLGVILGFVLLQLALAYVRASEIAFEATVSREYLDKATDDARLAADQTSHVVGTARAEVRSSEAGVRHEAMAGVRSSS